MRGSSTFSVLLSQRGIDHNLTAQYPVYGAFVGDGEQLFTLGLVELADQGDAAHQCGGAIGGLFVHLNLNILQGPAFAFGVHVQGQCGAATERGAEQGMRIGAGIVATEFAADIAEPVVLIELNLLLQFAIAGFADGDGHGGVLVLRVGLLACKWKLG